MSEVVARADPLGPERSINPVTPAPSLRTVTTPAAPLSDQVVTYERLRREIHERVRKASLAIQSDCDRRLTEIKTEFDRKESEEMAKLRQARADAIRSLFDIYQQAKNENEALLLRLDE